MSATASASKVMQAEDLSIRFYSVAQVATMTGLSGDTVRRAIQDGSLTAYKLRGQLRIRDIDFNAWIGLSRIQPCESITQDVAFSPIVKDYRW